MINRRTCRIKTMQTLFAYYEDEKADINNYEQKLIQSLDALEELYIWQLSFLVNIFDFESKRIEEAKNKFLPTEEDLHPNTKFINNAVIAKISQNKEFCMKEKLYHISWVENEEVVRAVLNSIKKSKLYITYMNNKTDNEFNKDKTFIRKLFSEIFINSSVLIQFYEEKNIYWTVYDYDNVSFDIIKTLKSITENSSPDDLLQLNDLKTEKDELKDKNFAKELFYKTIIHGDACTQIINSYTNNWDVDRIALLDIILCRMAITEFTQFPSIPVNATISEYIEISKLFSTPKSSNFINGILDKIATDLEYKGEIIKKGRGLIKNS